MTVGWVQERVIVALVCGACALAAACSSSGIAQRSGSPSASAFAPSVDASSVAVQSYLDSVNALCDALLPKVVEVTNGGSFDVPLKDFFEQLPAHSKLRADFDRDLAAIAVLPEAAEQARALRGYIRFANQLDARRLRAARQGRAAYEREIEAEKKTAVNHPSIAARTAAGFHESCNAR